MFLNFIEELEEKGINITFSNGKLKYSGPEQYIDDDLITKLKEHKTKLITHFWPEECQNIMPLNTEGKLIPFILLHGGSFFEISEYLGKDRPVYAIYHLGSKNEKNRFENVESFASEYLKQLKRILPNGPYMLGGMSIGGNLAYEMAIQLQEQGCDVPLVVMVDSGLYSYNNGSCHKPLNNHLFHRAYQHLKAINHWKTTIYKIAKYKIFPSSFDKLPVKERTDYVVRIYDMLIKKYKPVKEYKGEILLFRASENRYDSEYLGWDKVCKNISVINYSGNHGSMFSNIETIELIKSNIGEWLEKHQNKTSL